MSLADYINEKPVLKTPRLTLRTLIPSDAGALREWSPNKALYKYWGQTPGRADKNPALLFLSPEKPAKSFHWGVARNSDNKVVGELWVYLIENDRMAKAAIRMSEAVQGQGYGTEALWEAVRFCFENTELRRIWSDVDVRNATSCRVLEKCGFTREGLIRQGKMVSVWCDYYLYGILKEDLPNRSIERSGGTAGDSTEESITKCRVISLTHK